MRTRPYIVGFLLGALSALGFGLLKTGAMHHHPASKADSVMPKTGWRHGSIKAVQPAESTRAAWLLTLTDEDDNNALPGIVVEDNNNDGVPDQLVIADCDLKTINVDLVRRRFQSISFCTGITTSSTEYTDFNCDGEYDYALGPGREKRVHIEGQWYSLIISNEVRFIRRSGDLIEVADSDGVWQIKE